LELLNSGGSGPRSIIIRHADRDDIPSVTQSLSVGLNAGGREDARRFGSLIKGPRSVRLFHSPAVRCRETAEMIADGLISNGNEVRLMQETWSLCAPYLKDEEVLRVADRLGHGFMREWFDGRLDREWILPTPEAADMVLSPIVFGLREDGPVGRTDIHVSHDWEIVLLRDELFGTRYEDEGWVDYLDGIMFSLGSTGPRAMTSKAVTEFAFPRPSGGPGPR
jgi:hypothetical protein